MTTIEISPKELLTLVDWIATFEQSPRVIKIISGPETGLGRSVRAEVETSENEGRYKDITDYESW